VVIYQEQEKKGSVVEEEQSLGIDDNGLIASNESRRNRYQMPMNEVFGPTVSL